ncbi:MAG TPA: hypothetical protein VF614_13085 [Chthoniobacteraceae bacterium]|jgi:hypothetical protein
MSRAFIYAIVAFIAGGAAGAFLVSKETAPRTETARLERQLSITREENDRLRSVVTEAERTKKRAAGKVHSDAVEKEVEAIRGLEFKEPVDYNVLGRQEIKQTIAGKLDEVFTEKEFLDMAAGLSALGLLPPGYPLRQSYIDLLGEQVAAFYDQHQHKLFMFEDASLDNAQNRVVLAHELTHALQDQHFSLKRLPLEAKDNDDRSAAAAALVEGDATLVMSAFMLKNLSLGTIKDSLTASITQNMDQLAKAPRYLREMLVFPYLRGQEFCGALYGMGGYEAVSKAYARPPSSTSQILHPEKYLAEPREEPITIHFGNHEVSGQKPTAENTVGEMGMRILLSEWVDDSTGERAAAGWRGDRYLCYEGGKALIWKSRWEGPEEAAEFAAAEWAALEKRHQLTAPRKEGGRYESDAPRVVRIFSPKPAEVVVIDAADADWAAKLEEQFGK